MPSMFDQAFQCSAAPQLDHWFGVAVTLRQGGVATEEFTATWNNKEHAVRATNGSFLTTIRTRDYSLPVESVVLLGKTVEPKPGAILTETESGERFQILSVGEMPAVDKHAGNYRWLVHTAKISNG